MNLGDVTFMTTSGDSLNCLASRAAASMPCGISCAFVSVSLSFNLLVVVLALHAHYLFSNLFLDSYLHKNDYTQHHDVPPRRGYFFLLECNFHILPSLASDHSSSNTKLELISRMLECRMFTSKNWVEL